MFSVREIPTGINYRRPFRVAGVEGPVQDPGAEVPAGSVRVWATKLGGWLTLGQVKPATAEAVGWTVIANAVWRVFLNRRGWL